MSSLINWICSTPTHHPIRFWRSTDLRRSNGPVSLYGTNWWYANRNQLEVRRKKAVGGFGVPSQPSRVAYEYTAYRSGRAPSRRKIRLCCEKSVWKWYTPSDFESLRLGWNIVAEFRSWCSLCIRKHKIMFMLAAYFTSMPKLLHHSRFGFRLWYVLYTVYLSYFSSESSASSTFSSLTLSHFSISKTHFHFFLSSHQDIKLVFLFVYFCS